MAPASGLCSVSVPLAGPMRCTACCCGALQRAYTLRVGKVLIGVAVACTCCARQRGCRGVVPHTAAAMPAQVKKKSKAGTVSKQWAPPLKAWALVAGLMQSAHDVEQDVKHLQSLPCSPWRHATKQAGGMHSLPAARIGQQPRGIRLAGRTVAAQQGVRMADLPAVAKQLVRLRGSRAKGRGRG